MVVKARKITRKDLALRLAEEQGMTKKAASDAVDFIFSEAASELQKGSTVEISGFGKFTVSLRKARSGVNPLTKEPIRVKARKVLSFRAAQKLKNQVAGIK
ncbi:MAG: HU family DNA-binding protein [Solobacterium sp.]|nr:HU family DNA-binding protein [Solobacterium sp.]